MPLRSQLAGQRFGRLVVRSWDRGAKRDGAWVCDCDCGGTHIATTNHLTSGRIISCGCVRPKHGGKVEHRRLYWIWQGMLARCTRPSHKDWKDYGGRGITVCERWRTFPDFLADVGEPEDGQTLDRIDNDEPYAPGNVRWTSRLVQARNRRPRKAA